MLCYFGVSEVIMARMTEFMSTLLLDDDDEPPIEGKDHADPGGVPRDVGYLGRSTSGGIVSVPPVHRSCVSSTQAFRNKKKGTTIVGDSKCRTGDQVSGLRNQRDLGGWYGRRSIHQYLSQDLVSQCQESGNEGGRSVLSCHVLAELGHYR